MNVGQSFMSRGQRYDIVDSFEHERPATWASDPRGAAPRFMQGYPLLPLQPLRVQPSTACSSPDSPMGSVGEHGHGRAGGEQGGQVGATL
jgi:hypothetical protein